MSGGRDGFSALVRASVKARAAKRERKRVDRSSAASSVYRRAGRRSRNSEAENLSRIERAAGDAASLACLLACLPACFPACLSGILSLRRPLSIFPGGLRTSAREREKTSRYSLPHVRAHIRHIGDVHIHTPSMYIYARAQHHPHQL